ncbi:Endo-1,4-beta-xylanase A precursor [Sporotomaculum syntrophicum]|uniref:Endo-1,4-beta-xylanase A n=1 Tax=Sporotomaculum syntrophicum TaxID=182264 RepID=A0A9D3B099_9FIRM|nr:S-layer homology domain-containing protein [Sporotomaculum syntrophicum]KAF1086728.1 Endo-1,4-beta-xylanase A precursor [Sporotomaculum syntrophicum]
MKRITLFLITGLLLITSSISAAWAVPDNAAKAGSQDKTIADSEIQMMGNKFKDAANLWCSASIQQMADVGLISGYTDGSFRPHKNASQAEMITLLMRLVELNGTAGEATDSIQLQAVPGWAKTAVQQAVALKIISLDQFQPDQPATRLQTCLALAKALEAKGLLEPVKYASPTFADSSMIDEDDLKYIIAMYQAGYINGTPGNKFLPQNGITRGEMAAIMARIQVDLEQEDDGETAQAAQSELESYLLSHHAAIKYIPVEKLTLDGGADRAEVKVYVNLVTYADEWDDLEKNYIKNWLNYLIRDIHNKLAKQTVVKCEIINTHNNDTVIRYVKKGAGDLAGNYNDLSVNDVFEVEAKVDGDRFDIGGITFAVVFINYAENDEITVDLAALKYFITSPWDVMKSDDIKDNVVGICEKIAAEFYRLADVEPTTVTISFYDHKSQLIKSYKYDIGKELLVRL